MAETYRDARNFLSAVADMAEELRLALIPMSDIERARLVTRLFSNSDMVFGVWPDPHADGGVGIHIIKGDSVCRRWRHSRHPMTSASQPSHASD